MYPKISKISWGGGEAFWKKYINKNTFDRSPAGKVISQYFEDEAHNF